MAEITYRVGREEDIADIYDLLMAMHKEVGLVPVDKMKTLRKIVEVIENGMAFLAFADKRLVGSVGIAPANFWYSTSTHLQDYWTFVRPGFRKSRIAYNLLKRTKGFASKASIPLAIGVFSPDQAKRKNAMFRRLFNPVGEMFVEGF